MSNHLSEIGRTRIDAWILLILMGISYKIYKYIYIFIYKYHRY